MLMVRAHENHSFLAVPLLAVAVAWDPRRWPLYLLSTAGLFLNLALHDPLAVENYASPPAPDQPLPAAIFVGQMLNVGLNFVVLGWLSWALFELSVGREGGQNAELPH